MANPFLGKALKFPIVDKFVTVEGTDLVLQDIQLLLLTRLGERVMRPNYGCRLAGRIWDNLTVVAEQGSADITEAIDNFEPRVILLEVVPTIDRARGLVYFLIRFLIRDGNVEANLVFPFKPILEISQR